jgi:hypothetical protein
VLDPARPTLFHLRREHMRTFVLRLSPVAAALAAAACLAPAAAAQLPRAGAEETAIYRAALEHLYRGGDSRVVVLDSVAPLTLADLEASARPDPLLSGPDAPVVPARGSVRVTRAALRPPLPAAVVTERELRAQRVNRADGPAMDTALERRFGPGPMLVRLSRPLMNRSHTRALVLVRGNCGPKCGRGGALVLDRQGSRWVYRRSLYDVVS